MKKKNNNQLYYQNGLDYKTKGMQNGGELEKIKLKIDLLKDKSYKLDSVTSVLNKKYPKDMKNVIKGINDYRETLPKAYKYNNTDLLTPSEKKRLESKSKNKIISDNRGQWNHPGEITKIDSNNITMAGVNYPVLGVSNTGDTKLMQPNNDYKFNGNSVTEYPIMEKGGEIEMSKKEFIKEHKNLLNVLKNGSKKEREKEYKNQKKELKKKAQLGDDLLTGQQSIDVTGASAVQQNMDMFAQNSNFDTTSIPSYKTFNMDLEGEAPSSKASFLNKAQGVEGMLNGLGTGIAMLSQERKNKLASRQGLALSKLTKKASETRPERVERKYVRPEDQLVDPNELYPTYGTGTNYLAKHGKELKKANLGSNVGSWITGNKFQETGAGQIGQTIGGVLPIPFGKQIGGFVGGLVGGLTNGETRKNEQKMLNNLEKAAFQQSAQDMQNQYTSFMEHGGKSTMGGELKTLWGGKAETASMNPYLPFGGETIEFKGNSHDKGGIGMTFGKSSIEVEGGEPAIKLEHGGKGEALTVFGDLKAKAIGDKESKSKTFKSYVKDINSQENKQNKILDKATKLVENPINNSFDRLKFSSGEALNIGANMKLKTLAEKKEYAAVVQNAILETAKEKGLSSEALAKGDIKKASKSEIAKHGKDLPKYQFAGPTLKKPLPTIQDPAQLLQDEFQPPATPYQTINRGEEQPYLNVGWDYTSDKNQLTRTIPGTSDINIPVAQKTSTLGDKDKYLKDVIIPLLQKGATPESLAEPNPETGQRLIHPGSIPDLQKYYIPGKSAKPDYINIKDITNTPPPPVNNVPPTNPVGENPPLEEIPTERKRRFPWEMLPNLRPTNQTPLDPNQLMGEMYALSNNQLDPVQAQLYNPLLEQPYDISLQDQMNANQGDFNKISNFMQNNPAAQAALAGQKYAANSNVLGEQMRINQAQKAGVFARNRSTLNDAQLKNLGILDQQYVRQTQAKSNTKAVAQSALNSIASKIQQHKLENRTLGVYENLYNYWYGPQGHAWNVNPPAQFNTDIQGGSPGNDYNSAENVRVREELRQKYSKTGVPDGSEFRKTTYKDSSKKANGTLVKAMKGANLKSYC